MLRSHNQSYIPSIGQVVDECGENGLHLSHLLRSYPTILKKRLPVRHPKTSQEHTHHSLSIETAVRMATGIPLIYSHTTNLCYGGPPGLLTEGFQI